MIDLFLRRRIAEDLLQCALDRDAFAPCPGKARHSTKSGQRDFRVCLDGAPTGYCVHASCAGEVEAFNLELRRRIARAENGDNPALPSPLGNVPPPPIAPRQPKRPAYDPARLSDFAARCPVAVSLDWLADRSPVPMVPEKEQNAATSGLFLSALYESADRILIFTRYYSQGDFLYWPARGGFRLADKPGVQAVHSPLPAGASEGVWFLVQPVRGEWLSNPASRDEAGNVRLGRRHAACVTRWPYLVLESDEAPADLWLRALVQFPFPIVAIYTSGARSVHALIRINAESKAAWDRLRDDLLPIVCPLGADPGALSAVRLSRLPGCLRHGKKTKEGKFERYPSQRLQRLVWLNPTASATPILELVPR